MTADGEAVLMPQLRPVVTDCDRVVLTLLASGITDQAAARHLCVSVRTFRRRVARIMEVLGARSRFQAGVMAHAAALL